MDETDGARAVPPRGYVVILNGAPRSGKSSIVEVIQDRFTGLWVNLGVDVFARHVTPARYRPGMGLRPAGERLDIEAVIPALCAAFYDSVAAHSRQGLHVVVDVGHHDAYSHRLHLLEDAARRLAGLPVLFVGVRCPLEVIMRRRDAGQPSREGQYARSALSGEIPAPVLSWQEQVHRGVTYDLEIDTSQQTPGQCAARIEERLRDVTTTSSSLHTLATVRVPRRPIPAGTDTRTGPGTGEIPLAGGNVAAGVVRVGDTVRRPRGRSSQGVEALLGHLEAAGFDAAPRFLGVDGRGRQVLGYVEGRVDPDPADLDCAALGAIGLLVRQFHDLVEAFDPPAGTAWDVAIAPDERQLICHHDIAPWNLVRAGNGRFVLIDWDGAGPGSRAWDLSYAAHGFVPLAPSAGLSLDDAARRLAALVDGYGLDESGRRDLLDLLARRVWSMHDLLEDGHRRGVEPWSRLWDDGHGVTWGADARYVEATHDTWAQALLG